MSETFKINTNFNIADYIQVVENLIDGYFGLNGEYEPHMGKIESMRIFYNYCVKETSLDLPETIVDDIEAMDKLVSNKDFIDVYNDSINTSIIECLDFGNAVHDAYESIQVRIRSTNDAFSNLINSITKLTDNMADTMKPETAKALIKISEEISNGKLSVDNIVDAFADREIKQTK